MRKPASRSACAESSCAFKDWLRCSQETFYPQIWANPYVLGSLTIMHDFHRS
jgi:hypothetical protein